VRLAIVCLAVIACGDEPELVPVPDADPIVTTQCSPLTQAGCKFGQKCTWLLDAVMPDYAGHIGCAPDGPANVGDACMYGAAGATGYDMCKRGAVCSDYQGGAGVCKQICDQQGGYPECDSQHTCVVYSGLFDTGSATPAAGGVCDRACDPIADNDFDGSGSASKKTGAVCGTDQTIGCYGYPSFGSYPKTGFSCTADVSAAVPGPIGLRHRVRCTTDNGCADPGPTIYVNSCNQGYLPVLVESTSVSIVICTALCKPKNCYAGNCGVNNASRLGEAPHRCTNPDRVGTFDTSATGEHCRFMWSFELDDQGTLLRSPTSDTVGLCFDHAKYLYDTNADNTPDTPYPACATLPNGFGTGATLGAADLGCVDTANAGLTFTGKPRTLDVRPLYNATRAPVHER
jgi:hypothetical protein